MTRRLDVALRPAPLDGSTAVAVVVDVLRASTSLVTLVERECGLIYVAPTVDAARQAAAGRGGLTPAAGGRSLLIGEEYGVAPEGFDYGNSPAELAKTAVAGRIVIFTTTNGAPALHAAAGAEVILVGCLRNATAVAEAALETSSADAAGTIVVVCAGRFGNTGGFGVDDLYAAGVIVERIRRRGAVRLSDGAEAASLVASAAPDPLPFFQRTAAGRHIARLGLGGDVAFSAEVDCARAVPRLGRDLFLLNDDGSPSPRKCA